MGGSCLLSDAEFLAVTGGLDETIPMYLEDVELCWQAQRRGRAVRLVRDTNRRTLHWVGELVPGVACKGWVCPGPWRSTSVTIGAGATSRLLPLSATRLP